MAEDVSKERTLINQLYHAMYGEDGELEARMVRRTPTPYAYARCGNFRTMGSPTIPLALRKLLLEIFCAAAVADSVPTAALQPMEEAATWLVEQARLRRSA